MDTSAWIRAEAEMRDKFEHEMRAIGAKQGLGNMKPTNLFGSKEVEAVFDEVADVTAKAVVRQFLTGPGNDVLVNTLAPLLATVTLRKVGLFSWGAVAAKYLHDNYIKAVAQEAPSLDRPATPPAPPPSPEPSPEPQSPEEKKEKGEEEEDEDEKSDHDGDSGGSGGSSSASASKFDETLLQKSFATVMGLRKTRVPKKRRKLQQVVEVTNVLAADPQWSRTENFLPVNPMIIELAIQHSAPPFVLDRIDKMTSNAVRMLL